MNFMLLMGYGLLKEGGEIDGYVLKITRGHTGEKKYIREGHGIVVSKIIHKASRLELVPMYPVLLPDRITTYIMVYLEEKLHVPTRDELDIYIKIPVDLAVYAVGIYHKFSLVDVFSITRIKYCLYGPPDRGIIARYAVSKIYFRKPVVKPGEAIVKIHIRNKYDSWVEIGKILLDAQILKLYYEPGTWNAYTQYISFVADSPMTASIYYGRRLSAELKPIIDPPGLRPPRLLGKTEMLWGLV